MPLVADEARRRAVGFTRRRFVQGAVSGAALASLHLWRWPSIAMGGEGGTPILTGNDFKLTIEEIPVNFTGAPGKATAVNGSVPGPLLRWREGQTVTIAVTNRMTETTSIHWHGVRTASGMDRVPGLSFAGIAPGETFVYRIALTQRGTYWYHSHSRFQEQTGLYGPLIIDPKGIDPIGYDREHVVLLSDWTDQDPEVIFSNLKGQSDYYNYH